MGVGFRRLCLWVYTRKKTNREVTILHLHPPIASSFWVYQQRTYYLHAAAGRRNTPLSTTNRCKKGNRSRNLTTYCLQLHREPLKGAKFLKLFVRVNADTSVPFLI